LQISISHVKIILKFVVLSNDIAGSGTILPVIREIFCIESNCETISKMLNSFIKALRKKVKDGKK